MRGVDPLAELFPDRSPYMYAFNSPLNFSDPSGLAPVKEKGSNPKVQQMKFEDIGETMAASASAFSDPFFTSSQFGIEAYEVIYYMGPGGLVERQTIGGGGGVKYSVNKTSFTFYMPTFGSATLDVYDVTFHDETGMTTLSMTVDPFIDINSLETDATSYDDLVYQTAESMAEVMGRMGGVRAFETFTNFTHITITDNAARYHPSTEEGVYYDALSKNYAFGSTLIVTAECITQTGRSYEELEPALAHEIGHNVFFNFVGFDYSWYNNSFQEVKANYFMSSLGYEPHVHNPATPVALDWLFFHSIFDAYNIRSFENYVDDIWGE